jgi:hypothetical protein
VQLGSAYDVHVSAAATHTPQPSGIQQVPPVENPTWQQKLAFPSKESAGATSNTQTRSDSWQLQMQHSGGAPAPGRSSASQQAAGAEGADLQQLCDDMADYGDEEPENDEAYREADDYAEYEDCEEEEEYEQQQCEEEEQQEQEWGAGEEQEQAAGPAGAAVHGKPLLQPLEQQLQEDVSMDAATPATQQSLPVDPWDMTPKSRQALAAAGASGLPAAVLAQPWQQQSQQQQPAPPQSGFGEDVNLALAAAASRLASKLPSRISVFGDGVDYDGSSPRQAEAAAGLETPAAGECLECMQPAAACCPCVLCVVMAGLLACSTGVGPGVVQTACHSTCLVSPTPSRHCNQCRRLQCNNGVAPSPPCVQRT